MLLRVDEFVMGACARAEAGGEPALAGGDCPLPAGEAEARKYDELFGELAKPARCEWSDCEARKEEAAVV